MNADIYRELESGAWNEIRPDTCPCRGGWLLSPFDTWHRCKTHGIGVPHPEDKEAVFDMKRHSLEMWRQAFEVFRSMAFRHGFTGNFNPACYDLLPVGDRSPKAWVGAAETIAEQFRMDAEDAKATRQGFSSALEMRLADEAQVERAEREQNIRWING